MVMTLSYLLEQQFCLFLRGMDIMRNWWIYDELEKKITCT